MRNYFNVIFLILSIFISISFNSCKKILNKTETSPIPVQIQEVRYSEELPHQNYVGTIKESYTSSLSFAIPGNVIRVNVSEGEYVNKGQLIAEIDNHSYQESYQAALASLQQAQDSYIRMKQLHDKGSISEVQWVEMETKLKQAESAEHIAKKNLNDCKLYAPFSGMIGERKINIGMNVMPSMEAFTLLDMSNVIVKIPIPENAISSIRIGQHAMIQITALNNLTLTGKIDRKGVVANPMSHSYEVSVPLNNPKKQLIPGMVCKVQLLLSDTIPAIILPNTTVKLHHTGEQFVWIAKDGKAERRIVNTGGLASNGIIITSGLSIGDKVIVKGDQKVSEKTLITIQ